MHAPGSILVIQLRRLGDVLMATPALEALRRAFPNARIDFLVEPPGDQLLEGNPCLTEALRYDPNRPWSEVLRIRSRRYDWVVDFLGNPRSALITALSGAAVRAGPGHVFHRWAYTVRFPRPPSDRYVASVKVEALTAVLGVPPPPRVQTYLNVPEALRRQARDRLRSVGVSDQDRVLALLPFSRRATRRWPRQHAAEFLRLFHRALPWKSVVFWGPGELEDARWIVSHAAPDCLLSPSTELRELAALLAHCDFAVCCDNGPKHVAAAMGVPTLTLHGSSNPGAWNPPDPVRHPHLRREELFCIGCNLQQCPFRVECMNGLDPGRVLERVLAALETLGAQRPQAAGGAAPAPDTRKR